jgi:hypothetical protein
MVFELKPGVIFTIYDCLPKKIIDYKKDGLELPEEEVLCFDNFQLLYLPEQMEEMSSVLYILEKYKMKYTGHENIGVGIISYSNGMYHIKKITTPDKRKVCTELDLHYKPGFTAFYGNLVNKMKNDDKGLVLFYGPPGTGKTYCIRNLMNDLREDKYFVLVPPDIIRNILEPGFISFLTRYIIEHNEKKIVLICEDAENLLKDRKDNGSIGISNLLNMTDGILNDLLGFQVIATFNMDLVDLDKALLRTGRLLAQKEFTNLSVFEAEKLKEYLGVKGDTTGEMSLAEIYSLVTESGILRHNIRQNEGKKIGFV